jgi:hypothetical protein
VKLVPGIVSAGPPPRALAAPAYTEVARNTAANIFNKVSSCICLMNHWGQANTETSTRQVKSQHGVEVPIRGNESGVHNCEIEGLPAVG